MHVPLTRSELQTDDWSDTDEERSHSAQRDENASSKVDHSHAHREIKLLKERLANAQNELQEYQKLVRTRLDVSALDALKDDTPLELPKRDDDTHYFESYGGNGSSHRSIHHGTSIHQRPTLFL